MSNGEESSTTYHIGIGGSISSRSDSYCRKCGGSFPNIIANRNLCPICKHKFFAPCRKIRKDSIFKKKVKK